MENFNQENQATESSKLKILQLTQKNLATVGVNPTLSRQAYPINAKIFIGFLVVNVYFICNVMFTYFGAKSFAEYTQSIYMCSVVALVILALVIILFHVTEMFELISDGEDLINTTRKYSASKPIFTETVQFEEKLSGIIFFVIVKATPVCCFVPWAIYIFFIYFTTDLGSEAFELSLPMWFPFDWKNPFGFLIAITTEYICFSYAVMIGTIASNLGIGLYLYAIAMNKCIKQNLSAISRSIRSKTEPKITLHEQLMEYTEFDSTAKQFVNNSSGILLQHLVMIMFLWSLVSICGTLLLIQMEMVNHNFNLAEMLITMLQVIYAFGTMFASCELCQRSTLAFDECNDMFAQFKWYLLPTGIQRMLPMILNFVQQPTEIKCFGSAACNREMFSYVTQTAFSYFMVLREFS